ncbi:hypothetical protein L5G28_05095 [Gordonia sp. HY285]|uniref:hypothetical protein n=1 Tax=Gordonia liuliyuniae TaxID=2911517 RepID=UPI001F31161B|nr:hypothetical protein [Gordonia liuliyuniae]MCF8609538.1 hypothetical protein [Gordonia liuliyuniae]
MAAVVAGVAATVLAACGGGGQVDAGTPLPGRLVPSDRLPKGFAVVPYQVDDMIAANRSTLEQAEKVGFVPAQCRPTADAAFNPKLTEENTVLLVAQADPGTQSGPGTLTELVSTVRRNIDADRRDTSGPCRVVTSTPTTGALAGARIVNTSTELPALRGDPAVGEEVEQAYLVRTDSVTTFADGSVRARSSYLANVLVASPDGQVFTLQLGASGEDASETSRGEPPISEGAFTDLVRSAVERVAQP